MTAKNEEKPYVGEWLKFKLGSEIFKESNALSSEQKRRIRKIMTLNKYTNIVNQKPVRWVKWTDLELVAKELFESSDFAPLLFIQPKNQKHLKKLEMAFAQFLLNQKKYDNAGT